jgi:hypothetical protein
MSAGEKGVFRSSGAACIIYAFSFGIVRGYTPGLVAWLGVNRVFLFVPYRL